MLSGGLVAAYTGPNRRLSARWPAHPRAVACGGRALRGLWNVLEQNPGFVRQWDNPVQRIRDRLALLNALTGSR